MSDPFNRDHTPVIGKPLQHRPDLAVVTAPNASPMTFTGTQSYLVGEETLAIVDPGPDNEAHFQALVGAIAGRPVSHVLVTHTHVDHSPLAQRLADRVDAPILGFGPADKGRSEVMDKLARAADLAGGEGIDTSFKADQIIEDGDEIAGDGWTLAAIHTPGHLSNHLCYALQGTGAVLTGDHVMGWATTMVSPPDGDLTNYMKSMEKLNARAGDTVYYPGHGAEIHQPLEMVQYQINHRKSREAQILTGLETLVKATPIGLAQHIYTDVDQRLIPAAARNVFAHLIDLFQRGLVVPDRPISPETEFALK